jgi:hypothetical protein
MFEQKTFSEHITKQKDIDVIYYRIKQDWHTI